MTFRWISAAFATALLVLTPTLTSCNTVQGMGRDIQSIGRGTSKAASKTSAAIDEELGDDDEE